MDEHINLSKFGGCEFELCFRQHNHVYLVRPALVCWQGNDPLFTFPDEGRPKISLKHQFYLRMKYEDFGPDRRDTWGPEDYFPDNNFTAEDIVLAAIFAAKAPAEARLRAGLGKNQISILPQALAVAHKWLEEKPLQTLSFGLGTSNNGPYYAERITKLLQLNRSLNKRLGLGYH